MKTINIGDLKTHLSRELRLVRRGESIVVKDRDTAIATIIPFQAEKRLNLIPPKETLELPEINAILEIDSLAFLLKDRSAR